MNAWCEASISVSSSSASPPEFAVYRLTLSAVVLLAAPLVAGCGSGSPLSPDIAFVSSRDGDYAIYGMAADGSHGRRLSKEKGDPGTREGLVFQVEPAWSPDGAQIAFASKRDGPSHLFLMNSDGSGTRAVTSGAVEDGNPSWAPNGKEIAFERGIPGHLFMMGADGANPRRVTADDVDETDPAWSPDGRWIAYVRRTPGTSIKEIWLVRPDGSDRHQLTRLKASSQAPAWSPDSRQLAFSSDKRDGIPAIYTVTLNGKAPHELASAAASGAFEPAWSPDGKTIAFWSDGSIYTVALGGSPQEITSGQNDSSPVWRPVLPTSSGY